MIVLKETDSRCPILIILPVSISTELINSFYTEDARQENCMTQVPRLLVLLVRCNQMKKIRGAAASKLS
jgi:hypothetical protein